MSRFFAGTVGLPNAVNFGDISDAKFLHADDWSVIAHFFPTTIVGDQRTVMSKDGNFAASQQFIFRLNGTVQCNVFHNGAVRINTAVGAISTNQWWVMVVTHTAAGDLFAWVLDMDAAIVQSGVGVTIGDVADNTAQIWVAQRQQTSDPFQGRIGHAIYIKDDLSLGGTLTEQIKAYVRFPGRMGKFWAKEFGVPFDAPLGRGDPTEHDYSGSGNNGTIIGTADSVADDPPVAPSPLGLGLWGSNPVIEEAEELILPEYGQRRAAIGDPSVYGATIVRS